MDIVKGLLLIFGGIGLLLYAISTGVFWRFEEVNIRNLWALLATLSSFVLLFIGFRSFGFLILPSSFWVVFTFVVITVGITAVFIEKDLVGKIMGIIVLLVMIATFMVVYWTTVKPSASMVESVFKYEVK
jgi:hypothetical protein